VQSVTLSYSLKLYPTRNKADTLALLAGLFRQSHTDCTLQLRAMEQPRRPSTKGMGEFLGRAYRRAGIDWERTTKAGHTPGTLKAELIDSAELQRPKRARSFDYWVMIKGTGDKTFRVPARGHRGLKRTLALPGAQLNIGPKSTTEVYRRKGTWYCRVSVKVPRASVQPTNGVIGVDVGARAAVTRSDGYRGPDLRPVLKKQRDRRAMQQKQGIDKRSNSTFQKQLLCREARRLVSVASRAGRAIAVEDPKRLIRWKAHAARFFGNRVSLLASIVGVPCIVVNPAYSSITCPKCGLVERDMRHKSTFRCWDCGYTQNSDFVAAQNLCHWGSRNTASSQGSLSPSPGGAEADE